MDAQRSFTAPASWLARALDVTPSVWCRTVRAAKSAVSRSTSPLPAMTLATREPKPGAMRGHSRLFESQ
jgi:hypothetical protein